MAKLRSWSWKFTTMIRIQEIRWERGLVSMWDNCLYDMPHMLSYPSASCLSCIGISPNTSAEDVLPLCLVVSHVPFYGTDRSWPSLVSHDSLTPPPLPDTYPDSDRIPFPPFPFFLFFFFVPKSVQTRLSHSSMCLIRASTVAVRGLCGLFPMLDPTVRCRLFFK